MIDRRFRVSSAGSAKLNKILVVGVRVVNRLRVFFALLGRRPSVSSTGPEVSADCHSLDLKIHSWGFDREAVAHCCRAARHFAHLAPLAMHSPAPGTFPEA